MKRILSFLRIIYLKFRRRQAERITKEKISVEWGNSEEIKATNTTWRIKKNDETIGYLKEYSGMQIYAIDKMMAYESVAELLGLNKMVPKSRFVRFEPKDVCGEKIGLLQDQAAGRDIYFIPPDERRKMITPDFQLHMTDMNILDAICHERDHSPNNYNVVFENGRAISVNVFDNNGQGSFCCSTDLRFESYKGCSPFVNSEGEINRPHISEDTAKRLEKISFFDVFKALKRKLAFNRIYFTWRRIKKVNKAIKKAEMVRHDFLLKYYEWTEETVKEELNGQYGKTYLLGYITDCYVKQERN